MKRRIFSALLLGLIFIISLILHLPAAVVVKQLPVVRGLSIQGVQGTIWNGSAKKITWQRQQLGAVNWVFQWSSLLSAKVQAEVTFGRGSELNVQGKGLIGYDANGAYAKNVMANVPAKQLLTFSPMPLPITIDGQVDVTINSYRYAQPWCQTAKGSVAWTQSKAGTPLGDLSFGPVIADVTCDNNKVTATGQQESAQVSSEFSASTQPNRSYSSKAWFKPGAEFPEQMQKQLRWLGNPDGQGRYQFNESGRW